MTTQNPCSVYLVGAGPGQADLITLKGKKALESADVIIYDRLVSTELLSFAKPDCELLFVGKSPQKHYRVQEEINELIIAKALEGGIVVRLKGGDPFVFGRGGEEALALKQLGISYEIIPGVTSAVSVPAYAGIPVTHRGVASSFTVVTGHEDPHKNESSIAWEHVSKTGGTLVFLMGMGNLPLITEKLAEHGMGADTPVAIIEKGTSPEQQTICGTLSTIATLAEEREFGNPSVIVVGEVVSLREELSWFESLPLFGKRIMVTRARHQASRLSAALTRCGAEVSEVPVIAIKPPSNPEPLRQAIQKLSMYSWLVFTSVNGVEAFFDELFLQNMDVRALADIKLIAIGPATLEALESRGLRNILVPREYYTEGIVELLEARIKETDKVLLARAEETRDLLPQILSDKGIAFDDVAAYQTVAADVDSVSLTQALQAQEYDGITFTSSSTVHRLIDLLEGNTEVLAQTDLYSIGPITSNTLRDYGLEPAVQAQRFCIDGLVEAIIEHVASQENQDGSRIN